MLIFNSLTVCFYGAHSEENMDIFIITYLIIKWNLKRRRQLSAEKIIFFSLAQLWAELQLIVESQSMNDKGHTGK